MPDLTLACPHCHVKNRVRTERLNDAPACGKCGQPLLAGAPVAVDEAGFDALVASSDRPVVVDFWAAWCGPCRGFAPVFSAAAARHPQFVFAKVDTDASPNLSARLNIRSIPTLAVFRRGQVLDRVSGALPAAQLDQWLARAGAAA
jgi:thioredoxin 2